ncbi:MAG: 5'-nucleotidase, lipoprotein e(P4) family [Bacteroidales bacterium]|jgi:5'-nucleotidase (lipoprotein e(P4) family)|nr:5'-nucleotidase, lipoprotein e(P4) family [Bacteroidales bacterium]
MRARSLIVSLISAFLIIISLSCKKQHNAECGEQDHLIMSVLWFQRSAENRALFLQGYNIAAMRLRDMASNPGAARPGAIVADLDETILDNSPFEAWQVLTGGEFTDENWKVWTDGAEAEPLPGALEFVREAERLGYEVFYVSNRSMKDAFLPTLDNLRKYGFPFADSAHLLLKEGQSSKVERRNRIMETHDIVLLIGDNLADLDAVFEKRDRSGGAENVDSLASLFGDSYIVMPNPMYGSWVNPALDEDQKASYRERLVRGLTSF